MKMEWTLSSEKNKQPTLTIGEQLMFSISILCH